MFRLADPFWLAALALPLGLLATHFWTRRRGRASVLFGSSLLLAGLPRTWRARLAPHLHWLRYPGLALLIFALSRPQSGNSVRDVQTFGVDINMVLDVSGTMGEKDMALEGRPIPRLDAAKRVMGEFTAGRQTDRIGLIAFASQALTRCPLTVDYDLVQLAIDDLELDLFPEEMRRTAIGNALATAVARLYKSDANSKVVILLTDGDNNAGNIAPKQAAEIAKSEGIRVYTIGLGTPGRTDVNEDSLREIAEMTGGEFFRSTSLSDLQAVYKRIDQLEKSEVVVKNYQIWTEWFQWFLWSGCALLLLEVLLSQVLCRRVP